MTSKAKEINIGEVLPGSVKICLVGKTSRIEGLRQIVANEITIKGKKGELNATFPDNVKLLKDGDKIIVYP